MAYKALVEGKQVDLLEALKARAEQKMQTAATEFISCLSGMESPSSIEGM